MWGESVIEVFVAGGIVTPSQGSTKVMNMGVSESYICLLCYDSEGWNTCKRRGDCYLPAIPEKRKVRDKGTVLICFI